MIFLCFFEKWNLWHFALFKKALKRPTGGLNVTKMHIFKNQIIFIFFTTWHKNVHILCSGSPSKTSKRVDPSIFFDIFDHFWGYPPQTVKRDATAGTIIFYIGCSIHEIHSTDRNGGDWRRSDHKDQPGMVTQRVPDLIPGRSPNVRRPYNLGIRPSRRLPLGGVAFEEAFFSIDCLPRRGFESELRSICGSPVIRHLTDATSS